MLAPPAKHWTCEYTSHYQLVNEMNIYKTSFSLASKDSKIYSKIREKISVASIKIKTIRRKVRLNWPSFLCYLNDKQTLYLALIVGFSLSQKPTKIVVYQIFFYEFKLCGHSLFSLWVHLIEWIERQIYKVLWLILERINFRAMQ